MWQLRPVDTQQVEALARELGVTPTTARLLWLRGFHTAAAARPFWEGRDDLSFLAAPIESSGMRRAVMRLRRAFETNESVCVYGDYDCDGVTSAALLYRYLKYGPQANVHAYLPDRFVDGYGLNPTAVRKLAAAGHTLIVTCDNGISAHEAVAVANELGVDVIVTDHHHVPETLPAAHALVHPQLEFPHLADLSGVGVALLLVVALEGGWHERLTPMLDLVALGTVADVVSLAGPNRALVWAGLKHIRSTERLRPGLLALIEATGHARPETLTARNIAFSLAPMVNAAGRIEKPQLAFDLLVTNDDWEARRLARELATINSERREIDAEHVERVVAEIESGLGGAPDPFLVLADAAFHHGVTGIVAGRLKERYRRPVLLLSRHENGVWKGSGRSLAGCHLYDALASCKDLLIGFGGHAQAAGCSVHEAHIPALRERLNAFLARCAFSEPEEIVWLEATPGLADYTPRLLTELERLEPCGQGNPAPALGLLGARVLSHRTDRSGAHLFLQIDDGEGQHEVVAWSKAEALRPVGRWANLRLRPRMKAYKGVTRLELAAEQIAWVPGPAAQAPPTALGRHRSTGAAVIDARGAGNRLRYMRDRLEGQASSGVAIYTGEKLPSLELDRAVGARAVAYWADHQPRFAPVAEVICWEPPSSPEIWRRLSEAATERVHLLWESPLVEPELSGEWLLTLHRELAGLTRLSWAQVLAREWPTTPLMARAALGLLQDAGLVRVTAEGWTLAPAPERPPDVTALAGYAAYRELQDFRLLLANGDEAGVRRALGVAEADMRRPDAGVRG